MKILLVPLDDRPCNIYFPKILPIGDNELIITPKSIMGNMKKSAKIDKLKEWILNNINVDYLILSLDTLIYGGLIPSRLHHTPLEELINNLEFVKKIKDINPNIKIFSYLTIMRTPNSNFDSEEPKYYSKYGKKLFQYGVYLNKEKLNILTDDELNEFKKIKKEIPSKVLLDYIMRKEINLEVLFHATKLYKEGLFDYFYIPQDDSNPYGFTRLDQLKFKEQSTMNIPLFPGADEAGMVMVTRCLNDYYQLRPKVYVHYNSVKGEFVIPSFEDRIIDSTINEQILATNSIRVYTVMEADVVMVVNIGSKMLYGVKSEEFIIPYDVERNLSEAIHFINYVKSLNKIVGIADVAYPSGADFELINLLKKEDLMLGIDGYAGWNTASNTIGTVLSEIITYYVTKDKKKNIKFLIHRYYDDVGYCSRCRTWTDINAAINRGLTEAKLDGKRGEAVHMAEAELKRYMNEEYPCVSKYVKDIKVSSPWNRTFEMQIDITYQPDIKYNKL